MGGLADSFVHVSSVLGLKPLQQGYEAGIIKKQFSDYSYLVDVNGVVRRKHADQLRVRHKEQSDKPVAEERDTFVHQTPVNHKDFRDTQRQSDKENPQFSGIVPSAEEKEPELHPVVSVPQKESVVEEENLEETVEESEINETPDKTGKRDISGGGRVLTRPERSRRPPVRPYDKYLQNPRAK